jgi:hypothetical protein
VHHVSELDESTRRSVMIDLGPVYAVSGSGGTFAREPRGFRGRTLESGLV